MKRAIIALGALCFAIACQHAGAPREESDLWPSPGIEVLEWASQEAAFEASRAIEVSGLTASHDFLYAVSEKYATLLQIDPANGFRVVPIALDLPPWAELEAIAWTGDALLMCDEMHAVVYLASVPDERKLGAAEYGAALQVRELKLDAIGVTGGKTGLEGIAVIPGSDVIYLLIEREQKGDQCQAAIYPSRMIEGALLPAGEAITIPLEDCFWRLSGLSSYRGRLVAIKSQFPGERYEIVSIDPDNKAVTTALDLTDFGRSLPARGYGNNFEGIHVDEDGTVYLVSDNADTPRRQSQVAPQVDDRTTFVRLIGALGGPSEPPS